MNTDGQKLKARIPLSPGVMAANPGLFGATAPTAEAAPKKTGVKKPRGRAPMNKTEQSFAHILDARRNRHEILDYVREGVTLRWDDGLTYTPDFWVCMSDGSQVMIETKGPHIREDALVKFRAARDKWKAAYSFEMWQLVKGQWTKIL